MEAVRAPSRAQVAEVVIPPSVVWAVVKVHEWQVIAVLPAAVKASKVVVGPVAEVADLVAEVGGVVADNEQATPPKCDMLS